MRTRLPVLLWLLSIVGSLAQTWVRTAPAQGISIDPARRQELRQGADELSAEIRALSKSLRGRPDLLELLPDVEIFHKAVSWALEYNEIYRTNEVGVAAQLLRVGKERVSELRSGNAPWTTATGLVVRAYRSKIDGSIQPYGLIVPASFDSRATNQHRLDVWLHGRDNNLTELKFVSDRLRSRGEFTPADTIVLHPYGRYCNAFKFAGEIDVLEAMEHVRAHYPVDTNRLAIRGFSMGGAGCWHLATHYASIWAAAAPGAGFAETARYARVGQNRPGPAEYERTLWHWYDATDYAENLFHCPTIAYSGEIDKQKQAADVMAEALQEVGLPLTHLIGPQTAHKYEPATKLELSRRFDALMATGRDPYPDHVRFTTWTLRYPELRWLRLEGLEHHWQRARIDAQIDSPTKVRITTTNISAFALSSPPKLDRRSTEFQIDDVVITAGREVSRDAPMHFRKSNGRWSLHATGAMNEGKRPGLQGPIDDAFMDSFIMVRPSGKPWNDRVAAWTEERLATATNEWRAQFRGWPRIKRDTDITDADLAGSNLILWGDPGNNALLKRVLGRLPLRWTAEEIRLGDKTFSAKESVPVLIFPNPLNPSRYVVVNSGFTFADAGDKSNALQTPRLPDYAIIEVTNPATRSANGGVLAAGFFNERWELPGGEGR